MEAFFRTILTVQPSTLLFVTGACNPAPRQQIIYIYKLMGNRTFWLPVTTFGARSMFVDPTILRTHPHRKVSQLDSGPRDWSSPPSRFWCLKTLANLYSAIPEEQPSPLQIVTTLRIRTPPNQYCVTVYLRLASSRGFPASDCLYLSRLLTLASTDHQFPWLKLFSKINQGFPCDVYRLS